jgi:hypothetical protein
LTNLCYSSSLASSTSSTLSSISSSIAAAHAATTSLTASTSSSNTPSATPQTEEEIREHTKKVVTTDLKTLQEKFAKAADEGSNELEKRITEITDRSIQKQAQGVGEAHLVQLEETIKSELKGLKSSILSIIKKSSDTATSEEDITSAVRKAGAAVKDKAQAVRAWRKDYNQETNDLVSRAAMDTFEIIDHIRDLGLQEIGMRWAWMDGITHKDWSKYHAMKTKFDEWRKDVEEVATAHPGLAKAREASEDVENRAMAIAEDAVKELARLKETGRWKLSAGDASDDFSTKHMPPAAAVVGQKILDKVSDYSEAVVSTSQGTMESVTSVVGSSVAQAASSASSIAASQAENAKSVAAEASKTASSLASSISSSVLGTPQGSVESVISVAKSSASSIADKVSSSVMGTSQGSVESLVSAASASASSIASVVSDAIPVKEGKSTASSLSSAASSSISSGSSKAAKSASSASNSVSSAASSTSSIASRSASSASSKAKNSASSIASDASSSSSSTSVTASKKVLGGAMAQFVEAKQIIYEDVIDDSDDESYSEKIQSMASEAGDMFNDITKAVSEALVRPTSTQGSVESVTSLAAEQYSRALSAASVAYYGSQQGTGESIVSVASSVASSRYADAVAA